MVLFPVQARLKVKVKLSLCLTKHHARKMYWEVEDSSTNSLTLLLDGGEWSASHPSHFTPKEGGWAPEPVWTWCQRKIPSPPPGIKSWSSDCAVHSQLLYQL